MKKAFKMKYWLCKVAIILFLGGFATELHAEDKFYIPNFGIAAGVFRKQRNTAVNL